MTAVPYMGHLLTLQGLQPNLEKVRAVQQMSKLYNTKSLQRLLGFDNNLTKFLPHLSDACEPLR